jgi:hypothetical protein
MRKELICFILVVLVYLFFQIAYVFKGDTQSTLSFTSCVIPEKSQRVEYSQHKSTKEFIKYFLSENLEIDSPQCLFPDPQFSPEEDALIFNFKHYPACKASTEAEIVIINNTVHAKCRNLQSPLFYHDDGARQTLGGKFKPDIKWTNSGMIKPKSEYFLVNCGKKSIYSFVTLKFNAKASEKANSKRKDLGWNDKNFNVFLLVFDQVSRYGARRNLPKFMEFLDGFNENQRFKEKVSLYQFEKTPTVKPFTLPNMVPILYGTTDESMLKILGKRPSKFQHSYIHALYQVNYSIWNYYSSAGYITMALLDTIEDSFAKIFGRDILVDHAFLNFWRTAYSVYGWADFKHRQKCAGNNDSHQLSFDYLYQYVQTYKDNNKFAYMHLHTGLETSGNIRTADKDIVPFLDKLFSLMTERNENFVFILMSDHGINYLTKYMWDIRTFYESNDPMFNVFLSKEVEQQWNLTEILKHNVKSVVDRFDINLSLKDIAHFPYKYERKPYYDYFKEQYSKKGVSSIFYEKISLNRNCSDILTSEDYCLCKKPVHTHYDDKNSNLIINLIKKLIVKYFELQSQKEDECKTVGEFQVEYSRKFKINEISRGGDTFYYLELKTHKNFLVEVMVRFTWMQKIEISAQFLPEEIYPLGYFNIKGKIIFLQIASVDVLNSKCSKNCLC